MSTGFGIDIIMDKAGYIFQRFSVNLTIAPSLEQR